MLKINHNFAKSKLNKPKPNGFTLIEMLLVITLIALSVGMTGDILMSLIRSYNKSGVINEVEMQSNFIALKLEKELRNASNVVIAGGGNQISFNTATGNVYYNVSGNNIYRSTTGYSTGTEDALLSVAAAGVTLGGVSVTCSGTCFSISGSSPQVVSISMIFSQSAGTGGTSFSGNVVVNNTIVIINSY